VLFYDDTPVAMVLTVERIVGHIPRNGCRLAYQPQHTHKYRSYWEIYDECC